MLLDLETFPTFIANHLKGGDGNLYEVAVEDYTYPQVLFFAGMGDEKPVDHISSYDGSPESLAEVLHSLISLKHDVWVSFDEECSEEHVRALDCAYGILCQAAAKEEHPEYGLEIGMLHFILPERFQYLGKIYMFVGQVLMGEVMQTVDDHPLSHRFFFEENGITIEDVCVSLGYFLPCPNVNMFIQLGSDLHDCQPMTNYNTGYSARLGLYRLSLLSMVDGPQILHRDCADVMDEHFRIVRAYHDYIYQMFDQEAQGALDEFIEFCRTQLLTS